jgi:hypothetical protein
VCRKKQDEDIRDRLIPVDLNGLHDSTMSLVSIKRQELRGAPEQVRAPPKPSTKGKRKWPLPDTEYVAALKGAETESKRSRTVE